MNEEDAENFFDQLGAEKESEGQSKRTTYVKTDENETIL
jgi:hypothetical protein